MFTLTFFLPQRTIAKKKIREKIGKIVFDLVKGREKIEFFSSFNKFKVDSSTWSGLKKVKKIMADFMITFKFYTFKREIWNGVQNNLAQQDKFPILFVQKSLHPKRELFIY